MTSIKIRPGAAGLYVVLYCGKNQSKYISTLLLNDFQAICALAFLDRGFSADFYSSVFGCSNGNYSGFWGIGGSKETLSIFRLRRETGQIIVHKETQHFNCNHSDSACFCDAIIQRFGTAMFPGPVADATLASDVRPDERAGERPCRFSKGDMKSSANRILKLIFWISRLVRNASSSGGKRWGEARSTRPASEAGGFRLGGWWPIQGAKPPEYKRNDENSRLPRSWLTRQSEPLSPV